MRLSISQLICMLFFSANFSVAAEEVTYFSGPQQTVLIELYTSEGCNSCPPAEEYLNSLKQYPELWKVYIPVAFHVDYWDYLGWRDPYAHPAHAKRQSWYTTQQHLRTVYTPAFWINGKAWRFGRYNRQLPENDTSTGVLKVSIDGQRLIASYSPSHPIVEKLTLNIAVLGMELNSYIKAGENTGRIARHEFVVVGYKMLDSGNGAWMTSLPVLHNKEAKQYALAVWVSRQNDPTPLQAVGGQLPLFTKSAPP